MANIYTLTSPSTLSKIHLDVETELSYTPNIGKDAKSGRAVTVLNTPETPNMLIRPCKEHLNLGNNKKRKQPCEPFSTQPAAKRQARTNDITSTQSDATKYVKLIGLTKPDNNEFDYSNYFNEIETKFLYTDISPMHLQIEWKYAFRTSYASIYFFPPTYAERLEALAYKQKLDDVCSALKIPLESPRINLYSPTKMSIAPNSPEISKAIRNFINEVALGSRGETAGALIDKAEVSK